MKLKNKRENQQTKILEMSITSDAGRAKNYMKAVAKTVGHLAMSAN